MRSNLIIARFGTLTLGALLALGAVPFLVIDEAQANSVSDLSAVAQEAFSDLTTCLTSGQEKAIDVFYLVDDSDSLLNTDPDIVRESILSDSILQLASFAEQGLSVNVAAALFSTTVTPVFGWQGLSGPDDAARSASLLSDAITRSASPSGPTKWTNWEAGLRYAAEELQDNNLAGTHCQALIWFTDGGIRLGDDKLLSLPSLANLCHSGISPTNLERTVSSTTGLMAELKERNVGVFAVLFNNEAALKEVWRARGSSPAEVDELVEEFRYFSSFLRPLVEGSGEIYRGYTPPGFPSGTTLECADLGANGLALAGESNGAFLDAQDPISLAYQFLKLQVQIGGGEAKEIGDGGKFEVGPGTAAFRILTTSQNWELTGPDGKVRAVPTSPAPTVEVSERTGATTIYLKLRDSTDLGGWVFAPREETSNSSLFIYSGLTLVLDRDRETPIVLGRDNSLGGVVVRQPQFADLPMDLSVYPQNIVTLEIIDEGDFDPVNDVEVVGPDPVSGSFRIDGFTPDEAFGDELSVQLTLSLGGGFQPIKSRFTLTVVSSGAFPLLENAVVTLSSLDGPDGVAEGLMRVSPPTEVASGEFCISRSAKRVSDPQDGAVDPVDRLSTWEWRFASEGQVADSGSTACFDVPSGSEPFFITVSVSNVVQADSSVGSVHGVTSGPLGSPPLFGEDVTFEFASSSQQSTAVFLTVFVALLVLGILVPLTLLYLLNRISGRFAWASGMVRAEFPVEIRMGFAPEFIDPRTGVALEVGPQDFQFLAERQNPASVNDEDRGFPVARVPLFPLRATWMEWIAPMGYRVVSVYEASQKATNRFQDGKVTEISPVMAENWALLIREADLLDDERLDSLPGTLVVYSEMGDLAKYQARIEEIPFLPGLTDRIDQIRDNLRAESIQATIPADTNPPELSGNLLGNQASSVGPQVQRPLDLPGPPPLN